MGAVMTAAQADREIVLVDCPDAVGLIHRITGVLEKRRLNIETNHEFVDTGAGHFFFRAEVVPAGPPVPAAALEADLAAVLPTGARVRVTRRKSTSTPRAATAATSAPPRSTGRSRRPVARKASATPASVAWAAASPTSARRRSTPKLPITPAAKPTAATPATTTRVL
jgi:hypothetical protein